MSGSADVANEDTDVPSVTPENASPSPTPVPTGDPHCDTCTRNLASVAPRWCVECTQVLCPDCALDEHCNHTLLKYGKKNNEHMEEMREYLQDMHVLINDITAKLAAVSARKTQAKQLFEAIKKKIREDFKKRDEEVEGVRQLLDAVKVLKTMPLTQQTHDRGQDQQKLLTEIIDRAKEQCKLTDMAAEAVVVELQTLNEQVTRENIVHPADTIVSNGDAPDQYTHN